MVRCIARIGKEYLKSLYPCRWSDFISDAMGFPSIEEARSDINRRYYPLLQSLKNPEDVYRIIIDCYEDGQLVGHTYYLRRG